MDTCAEQEEFAALAEQFVHWVENEALPQNQELETALRLVAKLYAAGLEISEPEPSEEFGWASNAGVEEYKKVRSRFSSLPFQYYSMVFNPLVVPAEAPVVGDLHDDLADIYGDLKVGLEYWRRRERDNAAFAWKSSFGYHWGNHATSAMAAMHQFESEA